MPYKFNDYVSTYVDPQSVKIAETLRNRYMENFKANDQLALAVEGMKAAIPFENDIQKKNELQKQVNEKLEGLASRGDYENLGFAVHRAAKDFATQYDPIKQNYERYQGALKSLSDQYEKGDLEADRYNLATSYITKGYKGFEVDPATGKVKEGSMFSAPTIYKDPKIMDLITKRLEILHETKTGIKNGSAGMDENGVWKVTSGETISKIDEQDVLDVFNSVMKEPNVAMYLEQGKDMKLYSAEKNGQIPTMLAAKATSNTEAIQKLNEMMTSNKYSGADKQIITTQIDSLTKENQEIEKAKGDPELAKTYLKNQFGEEMVAPIKQYALKKAGIYEQTSEHTYENNYAVVLDDYKRQKDYLAANPQIMKQGMVTAAMTPGGATVDEKNQYVQAQNKLAQDLEQKAQATNIDEQTREGYRSQAAAARRNASAEQQFLNLATSKSVTVDQLKSKDPTMVGAIQKIFGENVSAAEVLNQLKNIDYNIQQNKAGVVNPEFEQFKKQFEKVTGGKFDNHIADYYEKVSLSTSKASTSNKYNITSLYDNMTSLPGFNVDNINKNFREIKTSGMGYYNVYPALSQKAGSETAKAFQSYFEGGGLSADSIVKGASGKDIPGSDLAGFKVEKALFVPTYGTNGGFELQLTKTESGKTESRTVFMPGEQITSPQLQEYMQSSETKFATIVNQFNPRIKDTITSFTLDLKTPVSHEGKVVKDLTFEVKSEGDADPLIRLNNGGNVTTWMRLDSDGMKDVLSRAKFVY